MEFILLWYPKFYTTLSFWFNQKRWGTYDYNMLVAIYSVQTFQLKMKIYKGEILFIIIDGVNISIYRPLSYPLRSLYVSPFITIRSMDIVLLALNVE